MKNDFDISVAQTKANSQNPSRGKGRERNQEIIMLKIN